MDLLFCYGTLLERACWEKVTGLPAHELQAALLPGWRCFPIPQQPYLGVAPWLSVRGLAGEGVQGGLREVPSEETWQRLDAYEGDEYLRQELPVLLPDGTQRLAFVYSYRAKVRVDSLADHPSWVEKLAKHYRQEWGHLYPQFSEAEWVRRLRSYTHRQGLDTTFVGILHGQLVAAARLQKSDLIYYPDRMPWLSGVWVLPDLRGCGIGPQLIHAVEQEALQSGWNQLHLWTPDRDHFYQNQGWMLQERCYYRGRVVQVMQKDLNRQEFCTPP